MKLSNNQKGIILIILGLLVLLAYNLLNIGLSTVIVVAACGLIVGGFILADGLDYLKRLFKKH